MLLTKFLYINSSILAITSF